MIGVKKHTVGPDALSKSTVPTVREKARYAAADSVISLKQQSEKLVKNITSSLGSFHPVWPNFCGRWPK